LASPPFKGNKMTKKIKSKVIFKPGCFDNFDGTQEELDELVAMITTMAESGELEANATELDDDAWDELSEEEKQILSEALDKPVDTLRSLN
jgi:hypothetical protein